MEDKELEITQEQIIEEVQEPDWKTKYMYLQAEFDNYRKRTLKEKESWAAQIVSNTVKELLPVVDDMERAIEHSEGDELIYNKIINVLSSFGVCVINTDCDFNPDMHEALTLIPGGDGKIITDVMQKGYTIKDKLIRPAKVVVK